MPTCTSWSPRGCRSVSPRCGRWSAAAARRPSLGRWQVVVIEDADRLTEQAANALLKAIEEPPPRTVFLLCAPSMHPDDVAVTIRSRCRLVTLRTPPAEAVAAVLRRDGVDAEHRRSGPPRPGRATSAAPAGWPATPRPASAAPTCSPSRRSLTSLRGLPRRRRRPGRGGRGRGRGAVGRARRRRDRGAADRARCRRHRPGRGRRRPRRGRRDAGSREAAEVAGHPHPARRARPRAGRPRRVLPRRAARQPARRSPPRTPTSPTTSAPSPRVSTPPGALRRLDAVLRLPRGPRAQRQAAHRRRGHDRGAAAARPGVKAGPVSRGTAPRRSGWPPAASHATPDRPACTPLVRPPVHREVRLAVPGEVTGHRDVAVGPLPPAAAPLM